MTACPLPPSRNDPFLPEAKSTGLVAVLGVSVCLIYVRQAFGTICQVFIGYTWGTYLKTDVNFQI